MNKLLFFPLLFSISLNVYSKTFSIDKINVRSGINIDVVDAKDLKARVFGYEIGILLEDEVANDLKLFFDASAILEKGSNEVVAGVSEFEPTEDLTLNAGGIRYAPIKLLEFRAGALNQGDYYSPLLIGANAFTAVEEKLILGPVYFKAMQSIPNNSRLSQKIGETLDSGTPYFGMETLGLKLGKKDFFKLEVSHFQYKDLSNNIAEQSNILGNSIEGSGDNSEFLYDFDGLNLMLDSRVLFSGFQLGLYGQYLYNDKAPDGRNKGYLGQLRFGTLSHILIIEGFKNESDTAPAFYNSKYYGHNNFEGTAIGYQMIGKTLRFHLKYYDLKLIEQSALQEDSSIFNLKFSKHYRF